MNHAVEMYTKAFSLTLAPGMATTLNLAGKQRMLLQEMAKEAQLILKQVNPEENRARLKDAMSLFEQTLKGLMTGDNALGLPGTQKDTPVYHQLLAVEALWQTYKPMLEKFLKKETNYPEAEQESDLIEARRINLQLLMQVHKSVNLYEQAVGLQMSPLLPWKSMQ